MALSLLMGRECQEQVAERLNSCEGLTHCTDLCSISEKPPLRAGPSGGLSRSSASAVARLPNPRIRLRFQSLGLPQRLYCGYLAVSVAPGCPHPASAGSAGASATSSVPAAPLPTPVGCAPFHTPLRDATPLCCVSCGDGPPGVGPQLPGMEGRQGGPDGHGPPSPGQDPISPAIASPCTGRANGPPSRRCAASRNRHPAPRLAVRTRAGRDRSLKPPRCHLVQGRARRTLRGQ